MFENNACIIDLFRVKCHKQIPLFSWGFRKIISGGKKMKRTISLIIAIAVMISMLIVPASAESKSWHHALDSITGAYAGNWVSKTSVVAMEISGFKGLVGTTFSFTGWVQPGDTVGQSDVKFVASKDEGATFEEMKYSTSDRSNEQAGLIGYNVEVPTTGQAAGEYTDIIAVVVGEKTYELINFSYKLTTEVEMAETQVSSHTQIVPGINKLTQNIDAGAARKDFTAGEYLIDLNGYTWESGNVVFEVNGATVKVYDSSDSKTGKILSTANDAINVESGKLTLEDVTVVTEGGNGDALFVNGGELNVIRTTLKAQKAGIDMNCSPAAVSVVVDSAIFAGTPTTVGARTCAIEFRRNDPNVTLKGDIQFNESTILRRTYYGDSPNCTETNLNNLISCADGASAVYGADNAFVDGSNNCISNEITYKAPVVTVPTFADYTISLSTAISIEYLVKNATEDTKVQVNGVDLESDSYTYNEVEYTRFTFSDFGPQQMGDVFEATLIVDGEEKGKLEASVKAYCDAIIASEDASSKLSLLAKDILAYGAAAQNYKNYNKDALVNADVEASGNKYNTPEDKSIVLYTMSNPSVTWKYATVEFANTIKLVLAFEGEADMVKAVISDVEYEFKTIETDDNGYSYVIVDSFTPDQFNEEIDATAYLDGTAVSKTIRYSVGSYANKKGNADNALADLVQAMTIYGESVAAYLVG